MNDYQFMLLTSLSVLLPFTAGLIKLRRINNTYKLFIYFISLLAFVEMLSEYFLLFTEYREIVLIYNIYFMLEFYVLLCLFKSWGGFTKYRKLFVIALLLAVMVWVTETVIRHNVKHINSIFVIYSSFIINLLCFNIISQSLDDFSKKIFCNPKFVICVALLVFNTYTIFTEAFSINPLLTSQSFRWKLLHILNSVYVITNFLYFISILLMPQKIPVAARQNSISI